MEFNQTFLNLKNYFTDRSQLGNIHRYGNGGIMQCFNKMKLVDFIYLCDNYNNYVETFLRKDFNAIKYYNKRCPDFKITLDFVKYLRSKYMNNDIYIYGRFGIVSFGWVDY